jgi:hypothetical protein
MTCSNGFYNWYKPTCKFSEFLSKCKKGFWWSPIYEIKVQK